jgi:uncharacterized protein YjbI with pentapeptide repeats
VPAPTTPREPRLPASLELLPADDPGLRDLHELAGVELHGARWAGIDASRLRVDEARLWDCDLSGASLADPELADVMLDEPSLANAVIRGGSLTRVLVSGGRLTGAQWAETRFHDTVWRSAVADLSAFRLSELARVTFDSCNLREADFTGASGRWVRFHDCDLSGAVFSRARFANSELRRCRLEAVEGVAGLAGTSMEFDAVLGLAPQLADALGIHLLDD